MKNTEKITVFHHSEADGEWSGTSFSAYIYFTGSLKSENGGIVNDNAVKIRIPSETSPGIVPGDRVMLGEYEQFSFENSFFIRRVTENLKGKNKHIRLLC